MDYLVLSQRNPSWAAKKLGFSNYTLGTHGCTVTALTMLLNRLFGTKYTPADVNTKLKEKQAFKGGLILWTRVPRAFPELKFIYRDYNYSNPLVAFYVYAKRLPVMVEVNGAKIGSSKHWVLYLGFGKACDPWTGKVIPTSVNAGGYPPTGSARFEKA